MTAGLTAAAEWTMRGRSEGQPFTFRGVDVFIFTEAGLLTEVRQYWRFDPASLTSDLVGFPDPQ
jgi:hypothetical protein